MIAGLIHQAQRKASRTARKAAFGAGGLVCIAVGTGFLTAAGWLFLVTMTTPLNAALIIGGSYFGVGLVLVGIAASRDPMPAQTEQKDHAARSGNEDPATMVPELIAAFTSGLAAGQKTRTGSR